MLSAEVHDEAVAGGATSEVRMLPQRLRDGSRSMSAERPFLLERMFVEENEHSRKTT